MLALAASGASLPTEAAATTHVVSNCLDSGFGSLRDTVGAATTLTNDVVDLSMLPCSTITLTSGAIHVHQNDLILIGPDAKTLTIDGAASDRVIYHVGYGTLSFVNLTIANGKYKSSDVAVARGGCIASLGNIALTNSLVSNCELDGDGTTYAYGGGIFMFGNLSVIDSTISNSIADSAAHFARGGGAFVGGNLLAFGGTIDNNSATAPGQYSSGGGLFTYGNAVIKQSTISGNRASSGAAWFAAYPPNQVPTDLAASVSNSTISGNAVVGAGDGTGGILTGIPIALSNSTIAFNRSAAQFGALHAIGAAVTLQSSIIADNVNYHTGVPYDLSGSYATVSGANNLIIASTLPVPRGTLHVCPKLGALVDNGGPTKTHALMHTSAAIDHGHSVASLMVDQRGPGYPRTYGPDTDIGAYEWQGTPDDGVFNSGFEATCDR